MYINEFLSVSHLCILNGWTDFDEILCVCLSGSLDDLDSQLDPVGPIRGGAQTGNFRFTMDIFVFKWLLLVIE